jgi:hypothetical protein
VAQGNYNEPFFWHRIVNVGWADFVAMVELEHGLINFGMLTIEIVPGQDTNDIPGFVGFGVPFSRTTGVFGEGWAPFTTIDIEDEGLAEDDAFVIEPAQDFTITRELSSVATPTETWSDSNPEINLHNAAADLAVGPGNWYAIKYVGPDTTIAHEGSPEGDAVPDGTTIMIWYWDEDVHVDAVMGDIFRHAFIVNFRKAKTVRVSVSDAAPHGTTTAWTVKVYSDNGEFVQGSDGRITPVDGRAPIRTFSGSAPDSTLGTLFTFDKNGFVS